MAAIDETARIEPGAEIAPDVEIGPFCCISAGARLGPGVRLMSHVVIAGNTEIGAQTVVHPFAVLGGRAQDRKDSGDPVRLLIGERNIVREHVTMHAGTPRERGETRVGDDNMFMAGSHVAHDCLVGSRTTFANSATLGGVVTVEDDVFIGGLSAVHQFCRLGRGCFVSGVTGVRADVIPFGHTTGSLNYLSGLNVVGLTRRGMERRQLGRLRRAVDFIFSGPGLFKERLVTARSEWADLPQVGAILDFIETPAKRPLAHPPKDRLRGEEPS